MSERVPRWNVVESLNGTLWICNGVDYIGAIATPGNRRGADAIVAAQHALASRVEGLAREIERLTAQRNRWRDEDAAEIHKLRDEVEHVTIERDHLAKVATEEEAAKERAALYIAERDREIAALKAEVERLKIEVTVACEGQVRLGEHITLLRACRDRWYEVVHPPSGWSSISHEAALAADAVARSEGAIE